MQSALLQKEINPRGEAEGIFSAGKAYYFLAGKFSCCYHPFYGVVLAVPPAKFSWTEDPNTSSVLASLYPFCCSRPISFLNTSGLCILSAHFCSYSYFSPKSLLNRNCCSHKNDEDRQKESDCEERFSKLVPFSAWIKPWTHRRPPEVLSAANVLWHLRDLPMSPGSRAMDF